MGINPSKGECFSAWNGTSFNDIFLSFQRSILRLHKKIFQQLMFWCWNYCIQSFEIVQCCINFNWLLWSNSWSIYSILRIRSNVQLVGLTKIKIRPPIVLPLALKHLNLFGSLGLSRQHFLHFYQFRIFKSNICSI